MSDYLNGTLWVDEFVSHHRKLDEINGGFDDMHVSDRGEMFVSKADLLQAGDCIRCVVDMGFDHSDEKESKP
jgi:S-(hydroxymethyl)glutathione dehydrogenase/alcohol dehydrogenase